MLYLKAAFTAFATPSFSNFPRKFERVLARLVQLAPRVASTGIAMLDVPKGRPKVKMVTLAAEVLLVATTS